MISLTHQFLAWCRRVHPIANAYFVQGEANAHLIAAAPDLYEALENAVAALESWNVSPIGGLPKMRAALAKARGEQS